MISKRRGFTFVLLLLLCIVAYFLIFKKSKYYPSQALRSPIQGLSDTLTYEHIRLPNGLKALIIHDPTAESASAALDVNVGWFWEPEDYPGLAHFLEHLLFMGTDKYPDDAEYMQFLSEHSGHRNAFTYLEHTVYFFSVSSDFLEPALDRFSQFFTSPLFNISCVDRERNAVNSEYLLYLKNDEWRLGQVKKLLTNTSHPYHRFGIGTNETLFDKNGLNTRDVLIDFYKKHYSSDRMRLVVYGKEPVDILASYVMKKFQNVTLSTHALDYSWKDIDVRIPEYLGSITWVESVAFSRRIDLTWVIPDQMVLYKSKPAEFLGSIISDDSSGGLFSLLKSKGWALQLFSGISDHATGFSIFTVSIQLTMQGLSNYEDVILTVFSYLNFLKSFPALPPHLFAEFSGIRKQQFHYEDKHSPIALVTPLAQHMHFYEDKDILTGRYLVDYYDSESINKLLHQYLVPENVSVFILANHESMKCDPEKDFVCTSDDLYVAFDRKEPWFDTGFTSYKFSPEFLKSLQSSPFSDEFILPLPNKFMSTDLTIHGKKKDKPSHPEELLNDIWFKQDDTFMLPKGMMTLYIYDTEQRSTEHCARLLLWNSLLSDHLLGSLYPASKAGLFYFLSAIGYTTVLNISGYSEKLLALLDEIINGFIMKDWTPDPMLFTSRRSNLLNTLQNKYLEPPFAQANFFLNLLLSEHTIGIGSLVSHIEKLQYEDVATLSSVFPSSNTTLHMEAFTLGNFKKGQVLDYFTALPSKLANSGLNIYKETGTPLKHIVKFPLDKLVVLEKQVKDPNSCVLVYFQFGVLKPELNAAIFFIVNEILSSKFFNVLRTREQFGYVVASSLYARRQVFGIQFVVQSTANPSKIYSRIMSFLSEMVHDIEHNMTPEDLNTHINSFRHKLLEKPRNYLEEYHELHQAIINDCDFNINSELNDLLPNIDRNAIVAWMNEYLINPESRRAASVVLFGTSATESSHAFAKSINSQQSTIILDGSDDDKIHDWKAANNQYYVTR